MVVPVPQQHQHIVVGVDGSPGARTALQWAMAQAKLTGATVEAIAAWQDVPVYAYAGGWTSAGFGDEDLGAATQKSLEETVADVVGPLDHPVEVVARAVSGAPALVLLDAARTAQLLVVGSRGHGAFTGMLIGSVSQHCVQHAPCPVVVVPQ